MKQPLHTPCPPQPRQQTRAPIQAQPPCAWSRTLRPLLSLLPLLLAIICPPAAAQKVMQPGAWEITTSLTRELPNQAAEAMGAHTVTMCLGSDFLAREPYFDATLMPGKWPPAKPNAAPPTTNAKTIRPAGTCAAQQLTAACCMPASATRPAPLRCNCAWNKMWCALAAAQAASPSAPKADTQAHAQAACRNRKACKVCRHKIHHSAPVEQT